MSLHMDENAVRDRAAEIAGKSAKRKSRKVWALAAVGTLFAGTAAFAAVSLYGSGEADVAATQLQDLTVDGIVTTGPLLPGETVGAKGVVHNPNNFPVQVVAVIIRKEGLQGVGPGCNAAGVLVPKGVHNANYGTGIGEGWKTTLATPVTVAKNGGAAWVEIDQAVAQQSGTTMTCGFKAKISVEALAGS